MFTEIWASHNFFKKNSFFFILLLTQLRDDAIIPIPLQGWWNWQTRKTKDLVGASSWGFKSPFLHEGASGLLFFCFFTILIPNPVCTVPPFQIFSRLQKKNS